MKKWGVIGAFILSCMAMTTPAQASTMYATEGVNVRTLPGLNGEIVDVLQAGEQIEALMTVEREGRWTIVEHEGALRAVCADYLTDEEPDPWRLWADCTITFYCPCSSCCGQWAGGATASGVMPTAGRTVACGALPFGTHVRIEGQEYIVEDTGVNGHWIDIYVDSHSEALQRGMYTAPVYILEG